MKNAALALALLIAFWGISSIAHAASSTLVIHPNGDAGTNNWTVYCFPVACSKHCQAVDEASYSEADYVYTGVLQNKDEWNMDDVTGTILAGAVIDSVVLIERGKNSLALTGRTVGLKIGSDYTWGTERTNTAYTTYGQTLSAPGTRAWTRSNLDSLVLSVNKSSSVGNTVYTCWACDTIYYTPAVSGVDTVRVFTTSDSLKCSLSSNTDYKRYKVMYLAGSTAPDSQNQAGISYGDASTVDNDTLFLISGLSVNTQYSFSVFAKNADSTKWTQKGSGSYKTRYTKANAPSAPTVATPTSSTLNVTTLKNGNPATTELAIWITPAVGGKNYVQSDGTINTSAVWQDSATWGTKTVTGLSVNTTYYFKTKARNGDNAETVFGDSTGKATLANIPSAPTVASPTISTLDVTARKNGNPATTGLAIWIFPAVSGNNYVQANGSIGASAVWQDSATWGTKTVTGLSCATTYYFKVKARNGDLTETTFSDSTNKATLANTPAPPIVAEPTCNTMKVTVCKNGNPSTTEIAIYVTPAVSGNNYVQANGSIGASAVWQDSATWGTKKVVGLSSSTTYSFSAKARNGDLTETGLGFSASQTTTTESASACTVYVVADSSPLQWSKYPGGSANHYSLVDDPAGSPDDGSTYIYTSTNNYFDWFVPDSFQINCIPNNHVIDSVVVKKRTNCDGFEATGATYTYLKNGLDSVNSGSNNIECNTLPPYTNNSWSRTTHPSGSAWTKTNLKSTILGIKSDVSGGASSVQCTQIYYVVYHHYLPRAYYVRKSGSDDSTGESSSKAWKTLTKAVNTMVSGDTVWIGAGDYSSETLTVTDKDYSSWTCFFGDYNGSKTGDAGEVKIHSLCANTDWGRVHIDHLHAVHLNTCGSAYDASVGFFNDPDGRVKVTHCIIDTATANYKAAYFEFTNNFVKSSGGKGFWSAVRFTEIDTCYIYNNTMGDSNNWSGGMVLYLDGNSTDHYWVRNNLFYYLKGANDWYIGLEHYTDVHWEDINYNFFDTSYTNRFCAFKRVDTWTYCANIGVWRDSTHFDAQSDTGNPGLDTDKYHLLVSSPCMNIGTSNVSSLVSDDIDGNSRPYSTAYDIGCHEYSLPILSISSSPTTWNLNTLNPSQIKTMISGEKVKVKNTGNVSEQLSLKIDTVDTKGEWTCSSLANGQAVNKYVMSGVFRHKDSTVTSSNFNGTGSEDVIDTLTQWASSDTFAVGTQEMGKNFTVGDSLYLWLQMKMPTTASGPNAGSTRNIIIQIGCQQTP